MLSIIVPMCPEGWDEVKQEFIPPQTAVLLLEHSLVSLSKWESKWCKPFLGKNEKTDEEVLDYIRCMTLAPDIDPDIYNHLTRGNIEEINRYMEASMTATTFSNDRLNGPSREIITAELIYYWMIALNIPHECQYWHLNRLLTLVKVCNIKSAPPKKRSRREIASRNAALNAARRKQYNTSG